MATVQEHYKNVLSDVYAWVYGGFDAALQRNTVFFQEQGRLTPQGSRIALDLGAGCGFQSIPLAQAGYAVTAIDLDAALLTELKQHAADLPIKTATDDLMNFEQYVNTGVELVVCMTDTILHLESKKQVETLFQKVHNALEEGGKFVITFRDLTFELKELDRFLPVQSDQDSVFTCFLEYEAETVKIHDILYQRKNNEWRLSKSFYRKLRLSQTWMREALENAGFSDVHLSAEKGLVTTIAEK